jgi:hypothetical protein
MTETAVLRRLPAPRGWSPQTALAGFFPAIAEWSRAALPEIRDLERQLDRAEALGRNTIGVRQAIGELHWRRLYTADVTAAADNLERVRALMRAPCTLAVRDRHGSFGVATEIWFLKLDASTDPMLADGYEAGDRPPYFLDRVNDPVRLREYLGGLVVSHLAKDGIDHRKELNLATSALVRLILRRRPPGYHWHPQLDKVIRRFIHEWQDPATGFFGAEYQIEQQRWRTVDLSMTFHMARYLDGNIAHWPELIDTLIAIRDDRYPNGWLDDTGMTSHNNYDVAVLFALGWPQMRPDQRRRAGLELDRMLSWCLESALAADGAVRARAAGEALPESYYFTIAFLDTVGFFDPAKRFWTGRSYPQAESVRARLECRVLELHQTHPMAAMALARLRR